MMRKRGTGGSPGSGWHPAAHRAVGEGVRSRARGAGEMVGWRSAQHNDSGHVASLPVLAGWSVADRRSSDCQRPAQRRPCATGFPRSGRCRRSPGSRPRLICRDAAAEPCRGADRRQRVLRAGRGNPPRPGRRAGLPGHRTGQRRRRDLAGQHLSGCGLRCPVAAVLVLLRAQSRLVAGSTHRSWEIQDYLRRTAEAIRDARSARVRLRDAGRALGSRCPAHGSSRPRAARSPRRCW